jgi:NAD(P)-dependent dehydrogenase (short-subunit alcohol dehydrogenase family)
MAKTKQQPAEQQGARPPAPQPPQHQEKPGVESQLTPRPQYLAPNYKGTGKLQDKVAIITGGDSGIGRAVAVLYAREGADVAIIYYSGEQRDYYADGEGLPMPPEQGDAEETRDAVEREGRRCLLIPGDVSDARFCREAVEQTVREFGKLDILVNNAAFQQSQESIDDLTEEQWDRTFRTNIYGYFYMVKAAMPHLKEGSAIVNTSSITALQGSGGLLDYSATKGAINAFTKSLAEQLLKRGIRVNAVAPGPVWTPLNPADKPAEKVAEFGSKVPMGRPAQPEEIAPAYVFFASDIDSSYITGEILTLTGGEPRGA